MQLQDLLIGVLSSTERRWRKGNSAVAGGLSVT